MNLTTSWLHVITQQDDPGCTPQIGKIDGLVSAVVAVVDNIAAKAAAMPAIHHIEPKPDGLIVVQLVVFTLRCAMLYPELPGSSCFYIVAISLPPPAVTCVYRIGPWRQLVGVVYCYGLGLTFDMLNVLR